MAKILVVDDEKPLAELLVEVLAEAGYQVWVAFNGREALALARREQPDVVLADMMMPLMTGPELLDALRADPVLQHTVVLLMSAGTRLAPAHRERANGYITKPFDLESIERQIHEFIPGSAAPP